MLRCSMLKYCFFNKFCRYEHQSVFTRNLKKNHLVNFNLVFKILDLMQRKILRFVKFFN